VKQIADLKNELKEMLMPQSFWFKILTKILTLLFVCIVWLFPLHPVIAQATDTAADGTDTEPSLLGQSLDADDISPEKISQFVRAYLQVLNLIEQRQNELQGAELDAESQQIQQKIEAEAVELIQTCGLTLQEYLQLLGLTNIDPEFGERVIAQLQEAID
jgi:hypothetical protein